MTVGILIGVFAFLAAARSWWRHAPGARRLRRYLFVRSSLYRRYVLWRMQRAMRRTQRAMAELGKTVIISAAAMAEWGTLWKAVTS